MKYGTNIILPVVELLVVEDRSMNEEIQKLNE